jgi:uncharacterized protein with HEPN domain
MAVLQIDPVRIGEFCRLQVVWDTVQEHLPNLIKTIEPLVPPPES